LEAFPPISTLTIETQEIDGVGDLAYVRGTYVMTFTLPEAPGPTEDRGKYLLIKRKQTDRSWLITNKIFNSDLPLPAPK
jgi:ketosteroid isomerase-like protein